MHSSTAQVTRHPAHNNGQAILGAPWRAATVRVRKLRDRPDEQTEPGLHFLPRHVRYRVPVQQGGERAARRQQDYRHENWETHCTGRVLQALPGGLIV